ncbi:MAG TPA: efflux RND transporter periplasmic adaptor subunit [Burkholderiales bacterium]|nr:efflux RND transporter periplasmic adaptor subunit [Burkholderiales bacterium]
MRTAAWIAAAAMLAGGALAAGYWLGTRSPAHAPQAAGQGASAPQSGRKLLYYRNPMGLPDTSPVPKKDPMGMDYIPVYEGEEQVPSAPPGTVKISTDKVQLLGVRTEPAAERRLTRTVRAVGTVQPNERNLYKVAPRFEGWIQTLHVNTTGQAVARGQVLMEVYSPDLVAAQEEYLIARRGAHDLAASGAEAQATMQRLADGVLRRLRNWDISERELERLVATGQPQRLLAYRSPASGVVLQKPGVQGMRFMPGDVLFEIADLSSVWLIAEVSEQDLGLVRVGQPAKARFAAYAGREFTGKVLFIYPALEAATRTARIRIEMPNPQGLLKPAMYADAELAGGADRKVLAVPDSAVLDSGTRQLVLVQRGPGVFEPREVKVGLRADGYIEVKEGVQPGEDVVVRANFLIDAESNLKAALGAFGGAAASAAVQTHRAQGTVAGVDSKAGTIEIEHGAIASLNWPAMTMAFKAKDRAMLESVKPGERVEFELSEHPPGEFVIERLAPTAQPSPPGGAHSGHGG